MRKLQPGLWHWEARHPEWSSDQPWHELVSSYAIDDGEYLLLFDPLAVPGELEELAPSRELVIVLTAPWHERDTHGLLQRLEAPVFAPPPDTEDDLMEKFGVTREQASGGSPDLAELRAGDFDLRPYLAGERLPVGIEVFPGREHNDVVLWIEGQRAVLSGDTLADFGRGAEIPAEWLRGGVTREQVAEGLRPLLDLPVEHLLLTHGGPYDRAALEGALS